MFSPFYQRSKAIPAEPYAAGTRHGKSAPRTRLAAFCEPPLRLNLPRLILACAFVPIAAKAADQFLQFLGRGKQSLPLGAAHHQRHAEISAAEIRIGADLEIAVARLQI